MRSIGSDNDFLCLTGGMVLTMDEEATVLDGADILVEQGRITEVGRVTEPPPGARTIDVQGCLVLPGLIQGHIHLGQTLFRGLAEGRPLLRWLRERIWPLEAVHDDESAYWSGLLGATECLLGGTTTVQDMGLGPGIAGLLQAISESGLRALAGKCLMDEGEGLPAGLRAEADATLAETLRLGEKFDGAGEGRLHYLLNPRFILSCSDSLWRGIRNLAADKGWPVHTHALEQEEEKAAVKALKGGRDEIQYFDAEGILNCDLRIAHGVWVEAAHLPSLVAGGCSVIHCPSANLKLGSGIADVMGLRKAGIPVGVGADGAPCNNTLDPLEEIRLAALLQQVKQGPGRFSGLDALRLATSGGAEALGLAAEIGSIESGKRADLLVLSMHRPEAWHADAVDLHDLVVYSASRASVRHVLVDGKILVENGRLTRLEPGKVQAGASRSAKRLVARSGLSL